MVYSRSKKGLYHSRYLGLNYLRLTSTTTFRLLTSTPSVGFLAMQLYLPESEGLAFNTSVIEYCRIKSGAPELPKTVKYWLPPVNTASSFSQTTLGGGALAPDTQDRVTVSLSKELTSFGFVVNPDISAKIFLFYYERIQTNCN